MTIGTRSVLYGAHCAVLHPWFLAVAWSKLYGFPWDVRLWASFCLHDIGYISKPNMDGYEGETHVELGAKIMACFSVSLGLRLQPRIRAIGRSATAGNSHDSAWPTSWLRTHSRLVVSADDKGDRGVVRIHAAR